MLKYLEGAIFLYYPICFEQWSSSAGSRTAPERDAPPPCLTAVLDSDKDLTGSLRLTPLPLFFQIYYTKYICILTNILYSSKYKSLLSWAALS